MLSKQETDRITGYKHSLKVESGTMPKNCCWKKTASKCLLEEKSKKLLAKVKSWLWEMERREMPFVILSPKKSAQKGVKCRCRRMMSSR